MKKALLLSLALLFLIILSALSVQQPATSFTSLLIQFPQEIEGSLQIKVMEVKRGWTNWEIVRPDLDTDEQDEHALSAQNEIPEVLYQVNESTAYESRWVNEFGRVIQGKQPKIKPFRYGRTKTIASKLLTSVEIPENFRIISRDEWGANPELLFEAQETTDENSVENGFAQETENSEPPKDTIAEDPDIERIITKNDEGRTYRWPLQYAKKMKFIIIHHTASQKNLDHPEVAIQNIYFYHSVRKKWGDIGYHYLIDPKGNIYEGRFGGEKIIGGHARPLNKVSVGIAVLGNYDEGEIPVPVMRSLLTLTNFLSKKYGINPDGKNIQGHRDTSNTLCPGKFLYGELFGIREIIGDARSPAQNAAFKHMNGSLIVIAPESEENFEIELKNMSQEIWNTGMQLKLPAPLFGFDDLVFEGKKDGVLVASLKNPPVSPGEIGKFQGKAKSNIFSGLRVFDVKLSANGRQVLDAEPSLKLAFFIEGVEPSYEVVLRHDPKNLLRPGEPFEGFIELKNTGNITWKRESPHQIALVTAKPRARKSLFFGGEVLSTLEQTSVKPGEVGRFYFKGQAPDQAGIFTEYFVPRIEGIRYLEDKELSLAFEVRGEDAIEPPKFPIRVKLSFDKNPVITSEERLMLFDGEKFKKYYPQNTRVNVRKLKTGKFLVSARGKTRVLNGPVRLKAHSDGILKITNWKRKDNEFRGLLEVHGEKNAASPLLINELKLEHYLKGIAEEPNDTPYEKIKAIAILARTYAQFYMIKAEKFPGKPFHLDDDPRNSQKYLGYGFEKRAPNIVKAVEETRGKVVAYQKKLVKTPYFSQSDGRTRSGEEIFGWKDTPYLVSVADPDCSGRELRGHGVGLSGCGALAKAKRGESAATILKYYYAGIEILGGK